MMGADEKRFNETLKRMLKTPPKAHDSDKVAKSPTEKKKAKPEPAHAQNPKSNR
ncbi:hypothetical protein [Mesorhizobium sangaii]|uniref:Uncharacterized protein n=1 Tax=Mesorhizobium sangaii TaxID=505389 RepID=A0A841P2F2_9HYPH|nr:hypothetical protein [Mesorhizobium sangaii]MBB6407751.1 hypothetical protein [Mesorhizobium sangaii]